MIVSAGLLKQAISRLGWILKISALGRPEVCLDALLRSAVKS